MTNKKVPIWLRAAKRDREVIKATLEYWKESVKDSIYFTDEEKVIFVIMDCLERTKQAMTVDKNGSK